MGSISQQRESIEFVRAKLELIFWAIGQVLRLILFAAFVIYAIAALIAGEVPGMDLLLRLAARL